MTRDDGAGISAHRQFPERQVGCTGYPADSHDTLWLTVTHKLKHHRCPECGCGESSSQFSFFCNRRHVLHGCGASPRDQDQLLILSVRDELPGRPRRPRGGPRPPPLGDWLCLSSAAHVLSTRKEDASMTLKGSGGESSVLESMAVSVSPVSRLAACPVVAGFRQRLSGVRCDTAGPLDRFGVCEAVEGCWCFGHPLLLEQPS